MKMNKNCSFILAIFLLLFQKSLAQRGYNYGRPGGRNLATAGNVGVGLPTAATSNLLQPIVAGLPTANAAVAATGFPASATAFGAPSGVQRGSLAATVPVTPFGGATTGGLGRSATAQRGSLGVFGANAGRTPINQFGGTSGLGVTATGTGADYEGEGDYSAIPGLPGVDYPIYSQVPQTSFDCSQQPLPGYYSDVEAECQVFHICALNRTYSFLCPNGTIFSQEVLVCVWWNQYDCATAPTLYENNAFIYDYGNRVTPTDETAYQPGGPTQLGIGSASRSSNFGLGSNVARPSAVTPSQSAIFGLRPTVTGGNFGGVSPITPPTMPKFGARSTASLSSVTPLPTAFAQTFPNNAAVIPNSEIGNIGNGGLALQTAQLVTSSTNREYLPPTGLRT